MFQYVRHCVSHQCGMLKVISRLYRPPSGMDVCPLLTQVTAATSGLAGWPTTLTLTWRGGKSRGSI